MASSQHTMIPKLVSHSSTDSNGSVTSDSSSSSEVRCCRCQATSSDSSRMVCFAINMYYCARCASIVGYGGWPLHTPQSNAFDKSSRVQLYPHHFSAHYSILIRWEKPTITRQPRLADTWIRICSCHGVLHRSRITSESTNFRLRGTPKRPDCRSPRLFQRQQWFDITLFPILGNYSLKLHVITD